MKIFSFIFLLLVVSGNQLIGQTLNITEYPNTTAEKTYPSYNWKEIEQLKNDGLPRKAIEKVLELQNNAINETNLKEFILTCSELDQLLFQADFEAEEKQKFVWDYAQKVKTMPFPMNNWMHLQLAEWVSNVNNYEAITFDDESLVWEINGEQKKLINNSISELVNYHLAMSITQPVNLMKISSKQLFEEKGNEKTQKYFFSFFEVIANEIISKNTYTQRYERSIADSTFYGATEELPKAKNFNTPEYLRFQLYYHIEKLCLANNRLDAYAFWANNRLNNVYNASTYEKVNDFDKERLQLTAFYRMEDVLKAHPASSLFSYSIATKLVENTRNYHWKNNTKPKLDAVLAMKKINTSLSKFPKSEFSEELVSLKEYIESGYLSFEIKGDLLKDQKSLLSVEYRNLPKVYFRIYKVDAIAKNENQENELKNYTLKPVYSKEINFQKDSLYLKHDLDILLPALTENGKYLFIIAKSDQAMEDLFKADTLNTQNDFALKVYTISSIKVVKKEVNGKIDFIVLNTISGLPISHAQINLYKNNYRNGNRNSKADTVIYTDKQGLAAFVGNTSYSYWVKFQNDSLYGSFYSYSYAEPAKSEQFKIYTDRGIYRPGQEVFIKVIGFTQSKNNAALTDEKTAKISVKDQNGKDLYTKTVQLNEFGSATCSFSLPLNGFLPGYISINVDDISSHSILVEEYKRPTFEVSLKEFDGKIKIGDSLTIKGNVKAFAGYPVSNAKVHVAIEQTNYFPRWCDVNYEGSTNNLDVDLTTDADGNFTYTFLPKRGKYMYGSHFSLHAIATDMSGEVHETATSLYIGSESYSINLYIPENIPASRDNKVKAYVQNSQGVEQPKEMIDYAVVKITDKKWYTSSLAEAEFQLFSEKQFNKAFPAVRYYPSQYKEVNDTIAKGQIKSGGELDLNKLVKNTGGSYRIITSTIDETGEKTITQQSFNFIQPLSNKQHKGEFWYVASKTEYKLGDKVEIILGSSYKNLSIYCEKLNSLGETEGEWLKIKGMKVVTYTISQKEKDGFLLTFIGCKNGHFFNEFLKIEVPNPEKELSVKLQTVRDFHKPGAKEKWSMTVSDKNGISKSAELLVGMYDASLDEFNRNYWDYSFFSKPYFYSRWNGSYNNILVDNRSNWGYEGYRKELFSPILSLYRESKDDVKKALVSYAPMGATAEFSKGFAGGIEFDKNDPATVAEAPAPPPTDDPSPKNATVQPRSNFNETAFFYPAVYADTSGNYRFEFTLPDALTKWRFMSMAHTKDLKTGYFEQSLVAKKELMVEPNEPRFFREGDSFVFSSKVVNMTDKNQEVTVRLKMMDPITEKDVSSLFGTLNAQQITVPAYSSQEVSWKLNIPTGQLSLVNYFIEAEGTNFSDAEKKPIPVLSNRMLISESKPFVKTTAGDQTFTLEKIKQLSSTAEKISLSLEMQTQPLWTTLMSLPYLMEFPHECAEQTFSRYFGNILAQKIIADNPAFARIIASWKETDSKAFLSELEKNPELKAIILSETPWIIDAQNEKEQRNRLALLFDQNNLNANILSAFNKLNDMKSSDGGWGWFGGESNVYITQHIVSGFGQLKQLGVAVDESMIKDALNFLEQTYSEEYKKMKPDEKLKLAGLSNLHIHWLVARSYFTIQPSEASVYYGKCLAKDWKNYNLHTQALAGISALRTGDKTFAETIKNSILDRATKRPEMGMYWNENKTGYYWNQSQVETQSTIIEFFTEMGSMDKEVQAMQLWLLQQKRTNAWETTKATTIACHALLVNKKVIQNQLAQVVKVKMGDGTDLGTLKNDSGSTFTWTGSDISVGKSSVIVTTTSDQPVFGAIHFQYLEDMSKIVKSSGDIRLERHYYWTNNGKEEEILSTTILPIGTKVKVKMTVTANRDMEFVHLKDSKASGFEARETLSGYHYSNVSYYQVNRDASTDIFIDYLPKGSHVFEYEIFVSGKGDLTIGAAIVECMYAPSFRANSNGMKVSVK